MNGACMPIRKLFLVCSTLMLAFSILSFFLISSALQCNLQKIWPKKRKDVRHVCPLRKNRLMQIYRKTKQAIRKTYHRHHVQLPASLQRHRSRPKFNPINGKQLMFHRISPGMSRQLPAPLIMRQEEQPTNRLNRRLLK